MKSKTVYFSSLLKNKYKSAADEIVKALKTHDVPFDFIENTKDIWVRDFMPVQTKLGKWVSFRYEPSYLAGFENLRTDYRQDISEQFPKLDVIYSDINLDGGNVVFSPSREKVIVSDRVFSENENYKPGELVRELERLLEVQISEKQMIIIPAHKDDMTGHADGMARFVDENTVVINKTGDGFEDLMRFVLQKHGIEVIDFPYFDSSGDSAVGSYLNFLETEQHIFLPKFEVGKGKDSDSQALQLAQELFRNKTLIQVGGINSIAKDGGVLNCISWEL